jgi:Na+-transporting methylmalonyl-CoA/oxaloacetate decarboxylase gamma subunit
VDNLGWGLQITLMGMGLVFALLTLLWGLLRLVLWLDRPVAKTVPAAPPAAAGAPAEAPPADIDADLVAAILVATMAHRAVRRREAAPVMRSYWPGSLLYASRWVGAGRARQNQSWTGRGR